MKIETIIVMYDGFSIFESSLNAMGKFLAINAYIMILSIGIAAMVGIIRYKKLPKFSQLITITLSISFILEIIKIIFTSVIDQEIEEEIMQLSFYAHIKTIVYSSVELLLFLFAYWLILNQKLNKLYFIIAYIMYCLIGLVSFIFLDDLAEIFSYLNTFEAIILIVLSLVVFYNQFVELEKHLLKKPEFWINSAVLFYFAAIFFFFIFKRYVSETYGQLLFPIVYISQTIYCLTITYALCLPKTQK